LVNVFRNKHTFMNQHSLHFPGLTDQQVIESRAKNGCNKIELQKRQGFIQAALDLLKELMFILLLADSAIYFITRKTDNGSFMVSAILLVGVISFYRDTRSRNALLALRKMTEPLSRVIRNGREAMSPTKKL
jgi:P-type Ca2+ transporter type 2C